MPVQLPAELSPPYSHLSIHRAPGSWLPAGPEWRVRRSKGGCFPFGVVFKASASAVPTGHPRMDQRGPEDTRTARQASLRRFGRAEEGPWVLKPFIYLFIWYSFLIEV